MADADGTTSAISCVQETVDGGGAVVRLRRTGSATHDLDYRERLRLAPEGWYE
jgi:hypothetical protein